MGESYEEEKVVIYNEAERIRAALSAVDGIKTVTRGWPVTMQELPCVAVTKASQAPLRYADGAAHVSELEYYIRVFADTAAEADAAAVGVDTAMEQMGYRMTFSGEMDDENSCIRAMRYRRVV